MAIFIGLLMLPVKLDHVGGPGDLRGVYLLPTYSNVDDILNMSQIWYSHVETNPALVFTIDPLFGGEGRPPDKIRN